MDDRISTLPDEILSHILSFLQSEQAVATSVLSKRWNPLWLSLTSLCLRCSSWKNDLNVPPSIFSCRALVVLKLDGVTFRGPYTFGLPVLKSLQLIEVVFFCKYQCFVELLNECPILEDLKADILFFGNSPCKGESINLPKLVSADIYFPYNPNHYTPLEALSNVQFLRLVQHTDMEVPVFSNLTSLELIFCMGNVSLYFIMDMLKNCPKLQNLLVDYPAEFPGEIFDYPEAVPDCLSSELRNCTLKRFSGVKCQKQFAEYILQNSPSLQTMTICSCHDSLSTYEHRMLNELALSPKSSPTCVVSFKFK